ncbi:MAG: dihydropteroate synthase [Candidatus Omnitrophota bacterium]
MIIIGERINSSRKTVKEALDNKDSNFLLKEAKDQFIANAEYVDINCAASQGEEKELLSWLVELFQQEVGCLIAIDSPDAAAIKPALQLHKGKAFINSISGEKEKLETLLPLIKEYNAYAVALLIDDKGMALDVERRVAVADDIINAAEEYGVSKENIFIDPLAKPISTEPEQAKMFLETVKILKSKGIKTVGGLSNVSFGLPRRALINAVFLKLAIEAGISAAIIDPTETLIQEILSGNVIDAEKSKIAEDAILAKDSYSMAYITAFREGKL